ncbi:MAG: MFS transporter [Dehalococcoidia bacterium]
MTAKNSDGARQEYKFGKSQAYFALLICCLLFLTNFMCRQLFSVVLEPMKIDLGLTDTQAGWIQSFFLLCVAFFSFPIGRMVDRWSRSKAIGLMALIWSIFSFVTGLGRNFIQVVLPRTLVAMGEAGFSAGSTALLSSNFPTRMRSKVLGIFNMMMPLGTIISVVLGGYLSVNFGGWRTPFYIFAIPGLILGVIAFFLRDYPTVNNNQGGKGNSLIKDAQKMLKIPTLKWMYLGWGMHNFMYYAVSAWMPALFIRTLNIAEDKAGLITGVVIAASVISAPLGGFIADSWHKGNHQSRKLLVPLAGNIISIVAVCLSIAALNLKLFVPAFILLGIWGIGSLLGVGPVNAVSQDVVTPAYRGTSWGLAMFFMYLIGAWSPVLIGMISDILGGGASGLGIAIAVASIISVPAAYFCWLAS